MNGHHFYWVKFIHDKPFRIEAKNWMDFCEYVGRLSMERGPIEWIIKD